MASTRPAPAPPQAIAISGASGLVGRALATALSSEGHRVVPLVRPGSVGDGVRWNPSEGPALPDGLVADAVVHLAGENIGGGRWTAARKQRIRDSRVVGTRRLAEALAALPAPPRTFIVASAVGIYGDRGDAWVDEDSPPGTGFLAEVCQAWEAAAQPACSAGIRVVQVRIGVVMSPEGGALPRLLWPFRLGLGGPVGTGRQYVSWIALDDLVGVFRFLLARTDIAGAVNAVAPHPVTNADLARILGAVLGRPAVLPLPAAAVKLLLGEMGAALLLSGALVRPKVLTEAGFVFRHPDLEEALRALL
ncbi:MAG: TIGR01777 family protein [Deltaproteobacteria bacterium]|nr:MAG: TIGR01777 family protein [Deltaproteobacteria bacterium]